MRWFIAGMIVLIFCAACTQDEDNTIGYELAEREQSQPFFVQFNEPVADTYYRSEISGNIGTTQNLAVGRWQGMEARTFIRFDALPNDFYDDDVRSRLENISAKLSLYFHSQSDETPLHFTIHRVTQDFNPYAFTWEDASDDTIWTTPGGTFEPDPIATVHTTISIGTSDSTGGELVEIDVTDLIWEWAEDLDDLEEDDILKLNLCLVPHEEMTSMALLYAGEVLKLTSSSDPVPYANSYPRIDVDYRYTGSEDLTSEMNVYLSIISGLQIYDDGYIVKGYDPQETAGQESLLELNCGMFYRGLLKFSVEDSIPPEATINYAELVMIADSTLEGKFARIYDEDSLFVDVDYLAVSLYPVEVDVDEGEVEWDESFSGDRINYGYSTQVIPLDNEIHHDRLDTLRYDITNLVQVWANDPDLNHGVMLRGGWECSNFTRGWIFSREAPADKRPYLLVHYTLPPTSPWEN